MLAIRRQNLIKEMIVEQKSVTVSELAIKFAVTEETIRRDLKGMENEGFVTRVYGGAFIQEGALNEISLPIRETSYIENKKIIGKQCAKIVHNGDSVFLDSSTTAFFVAEALSNHRITIITDSMKILNLLATYDNIRLHGIGGTLTSRYMSFTGSGAITSLERYFVDKAFISCRSLSIENGVTDSTEILADIRKKVIERSNQTYIIADFSKFGKTSFVNITDFDKVSAIVTDKPLKKTWIDFAKKKNIRIYDTTQDL